jgi:DNA processing protein
MNRVVRTLSERERIDWVRLARSELIGPAHFFTLLAAFGSAERALAALPDMARRARRASLRLASRADAERELEQLAARGAMLIGWSEPEYPAALAATEGAPPLIACRGRRELLTRSCVAVVGARDASTNGRRLAERIARDLASADLVVVSGLARGIDAAAHRGALDSGTIAVVAGGIDVCYPPENRSLYEAIGDRGLLVAEQPYGTLPHARHFPRRNRIISGLSGGVVVVEAALRSGSLITARFALEQGREVFAVPGSPLDARSQGCNDLIRQGATLTESAADVLSGLGAMSPRTPEAPIEAEPSAPREQISESERGIVLRRLSASPTTVDDLVRDSALTAGVVALALLELELAGRVERHPGNRVALIGENTAAVP